MRRHLVKLLAAGTAALSLVAATNPTVQGLLDGYSLDHIRVHQQKQAGAEVESDVGIPASAVTGSAVECVDGMAGEFACDGIDLLSFVPREDFGGELSDIWGWTDPQTGDEYVIVGKTDGTGFFRITDPLNPVYLGEIENPGLARIWHDVKVSDDHAFIVSESYLHGMLVFDLTRLRDVETPQTFEPDTRYVGTDANAISTSIHNIVIDEGSKTAFLVGSSANALLTRRGACASGLHMVDISEPTSPSFAGCYTEDAYIHDAQCTLYEGPDVEHDGKRICVGSNEDTVSVIDVTDPADAKLIGRVSYPDVEYTHQGWLTSDQSYFLLGDELDEARKRFNTRTLIVDLTDLDQPAVTEHFHDTAAIDHNMYEHDGLLYQSNYTAGLRVQALDELDQGRLREIAFFDTYPNDDAATFNGTWSNYPYFDSGTIAVTGIGEGLFLLKLQDGVAAR